MSHIKSASLEKTERRIVLTLTVWAIAVAVTGYFQLWTQIPLPSISILVIIAITTLLILYYRNHQFQVYIAAIHPKHLTIIHLWRILAGFAFLYYGSQGLLPEQFVLNAGYGDLVVGFLVPLILLLPEHNNKYIAFHIFSLLDFILAVGTGLTFTLLQIPLMENIATYPIVLIPLFGVPVTGASSVMAIMALVKQHQKISSIS